MIKVAVSITVKDDYLFINEFINYYKKIGFDKIMIFDDGSSRDFLSKISYDKSLIIIKKNKNHRNIKGRISIKKEKKFVKFFFSYV